MAANAAPTVVVRESARREETFRALKAGLYIRSLKGALISSTLEPRSDFLVSKFAFKWVNSYRYIKERGAPHLPAQYPDADEAASVLLAAGGPVDVAYHALKL